MTPAPQLDLLDWTPPPASARRKPPPAPSIAPPEPLPFPPRRPAEWEQLVAAANAPINVMASLLWSGEVLEVLSEHAERRRRLFLLRDGTIREVAPDPAHYRTIYVNPGEALRLHATRPLICLGIGTHSGSYRFAAGDEPVPDLRLPAGGS